MFADHFSDLAPARSRRYRGRRSTGSFVVQPAIGRAQDATADLILARICSTTTTFRPCAR